MTSVFSIPSITTIKESFIHQAQYFGVEVEYPTKGQMQNLRKKIMTNTSNLTCMKNDLQPFNRSIVIAKLENFAKFQTNIIKK